VEKLLSSQQPLILTALMSLEKRQLAAILFADIAGYTALMQEDERYAGELLSKFQEG